MTYTTPATPTANTNLKTPVAATTAQIRRLSVDDRLALLWYVYTDMGQFVTPAAPGAARLQLAQGLLEQFERMSYQEQLQAMRDLDRNANTPICRAYGILSANTQLAFWYQLAQWMRQGKVVPMPADHQTSAEVRSARYAIRNLEFGQQLTVLRNAVATMGNDPLVQ